jgi:hypothetical protein
MDYRRHGFGRAAALLPRASRSIHS